MFRRSPSFLTASTSLFVKRRFSVTARLTTDRQSDPAVHEIHGPVDVNTFRRIAVCGPERPLVLRSQAMSGSDNGTHDAAPPVVLPALGKWFLASEQEARLSPYFTQHLPHPVPYELLFSPSTDPSSSTSNSARFLRWLSSSETPSYKALHSLLQDAIHAQPTHGSQDTRFIRFDAPLALLHAALEFNRCQSLSDRRLSQLYIAQALLPDLPHELQLDVPTPQLLTAPPTPQLPWSADVYGSSIWIGLEPTYTPWHRDPNPNLFCQLNSSKVIRLMPPRAGERLFKKVMAGLGAVRGSAAIRGEEMMQGAERRAWLDAVWGPDTPAGMLEVVLHPRDVLFFHKGWWHSVKSMGESGALNASVNWWFRWRAHSR
ncbi:hypothetical protein VTI74DRAFT_1246 [Chaetomium olivicolor]